MCPPSDSMSAWVSCPAPDKLPLASSGLGLPWVDFVCLLRFVFLDGLRGCRIKPHPVFGVEAGRGENSSLPFGSRANHRTGSPAATLGRVRFQVNNASHLTFPSDDVHGLALNRPIPKVRTLAARIIAPA